MDWLINVWYPIALAIVMVRIMEIAYAHQHKGVKIHDKQAEQSKNG